MRCWTRYWKIYRTGQYPAEIIDAGFDRETVYRVIRLVDKNEYKAARPRRGSGSPNAPSAATALSDHLPLHGIIICRLA